MNWKPWVRKLLNFVVTIVLGLIAAVYAVVAPGGLFGPQVLVGCGIIFLAKMALNLALTKGDPLDRPVWIFNAFSSAVLFFATAFVLALNERAWRGSVHGSLNTAVLDVAFEVLLIVFVATILAKPAVKALPWRGFKQSTLWLLILWCVFGAGCAYLYPRNGMLMDYETWIHAGMPGKPSPSDDKFWAPLRPQQK